MIKNSKPVFTWEAARDSDPLDGVSYTLEYSKDAGFSAGNTYAVTVSTNYYALLAGLADDSTYYWRVSAADNFNAVKICSSTFILFVNLNNTAPGPFSLTEPADNASVVSDRPLFDWQDSVEPDPLDYVTYSLYISTEPGFTSTAVYAGLSESRYAPDAVHRLRENTTYFWKVLSQDTTGEITASETRSFHIPVLSVPKEPPGVKGTLSGSVFILRWDPVNANEDGTQIDDLAGYNIYRSDIMSSWLNRAVYVAVSSNTTLFQENIAAGEVYYYMVKAVDTSGNLSESTIISNSSGAGNITVVSPENDLIIDLASADSSKMAAGNNKYNDNLRLEITRNNIPGALSSVVIEYEIKVRKVLSGDEVPDFGFSESMELSFVPPETGAMSVLSVGKAVPAGYAVYWFNGVEYIKTGSRPAPGAITLKTKNLGKYQLRRVTLSGEFSVSRAWPSKVFTPDNDSINDVFHVAYENPADQRVEGKIFDINGRFVGRMAQGSIENSLEWDGRDTGGGYAPKGVYLYQLESAGKIINGTIVVAR